MLEWRAVLGFPKGLRGSKTRGLYEVETLRTDNPLHLACEHTNRDRSFLPKTARAFSFWADFWDSDSCKNPSKAWSASASMKWYLANAQIRPIQPGDDQHRLLPGLPTGTFASLRIESVANRRI